MRAHFFRPVTDEAGNLLPNVQVSVFQPGTTTLISGVVYGDDSATPAILGNPFVSSTGFISFYLDTPQRVRVAVLQGNLPVTYFDDVDVLAAGSDSPHIGTGLLSLVIGTGANASGDHSVALGASAQAAGTQGVGVGSSANAVGNASIAVGAATTSSTGEVAVGNAASTSGGSSVALGPSAQALGATSTALGSGASATGTNSAAIGAGAVAPLDNQIMIGTPTTYAEIPAGSGVVLTSPDGTRYRLTVDNGGALDTEPA